MNNLIEDLSATTCIPTADIKKLSNIAEDVICHSVMEDIISFNSITSIDIEIGILRITNTSDGVKYKFIPKESLNNKVTKVYQTKKSPLKARAEKAISTRLKLAYKELL